MIDLIFSCLTNAIYIITSCILFVFLTSRILPSYFLKPKYTITTQKSTVLKNHLSESGNLTVYEPEQDIQKYIPQYILIDNKGEKFLKCKFADNIANIKYSVTAFDSHNNIIDTIDVFDIPNNTEVANTICLPFSTDSISLSVYKVNDKKVGQSNVVFISPLSYALYFVLNFAVAAAFSLFFNYIIINVIKTFFEYNQTVFGHGVGLRIFISLTISAVYALISIRKKHKEVCKSAFNARSRNSKKIKASLILSVICLVLISVVNMVRPVILNFQSDIQQFIGEFINSILS